MKVFTYFNQANFELTAPISRSNVPNVARVQINVGATTANREKGLRLTTSVVPRSMTNPLISNVPPPDCAQANLRAVSDGNTPSAPVVSWSATDNANNFTVARVSPTPVTWAATTTNPNTFTDTAMRGRHGTTIRYTLDLDGAGGTVQCSFDYVVPARAPLGAPVVTATLNPDTRISPSSNAFTPSVSLNWAPVPDATAYTVMTRVIDGNTNPWNAIVPGTWSTLGNTTSTSYTHTPGFDVAYEYKVVASSSDYTPALSSPDSNAQKVLTHPGAITNVVASPLTYRTNRVTWNATPSSTADGYQVWRRPTGTSPWASVANVPGVGTLAVNDPNAALGSRYDYMVTVYNDGPRGGCAATSPYTCPSVRFYGPPSNIDDALQFPANPVTSATGTENNNAFNPDGRNTASWTPSPTATSYELWQFDTAASTVAARTARNTGITGLSAADTGESRGSRNFYMAVAVNATGPSENSVSPGNQAVAYQRPEAPAVTDPTTATAIPGGGSDNSSIADRSAALSYETNADNGEGADKFCAGANAGECSYRIQQNSNTVLSQFGIPANPRWSGAGTAWGATDNMEVRACNLGGCASTPLNLLSYPGPFTSVGGTNTAERDKYVWAAGADTDQRLGSDRGEYPTYAPRWSASEGVRATNGYLVQRRELADDPGNRSIDRWYDGGCVYPCTGAADLTTSGSSMTVTVTAHAPNGLTRSDSATHQQAPGVVAFNESSRYCRDNQTNGSGSGQGWKIGYRTRLNALTRIYGTPMVTYSDAVIGTEVVGRWRSTEGTIFSQINDDILAKSITGDSRPNTSNAWPDNFTYGNLWWLNYRWTPSSATIPARMAVAGTAANDAYYIDKSDGAGGGARAALQVTRTGAHNTDFGDWVGHSQYQSEFTPGGGIPNCAATYDSWRFIPGTISRAAHPNSPGFSDQSNNNWGITG